MILFCRLIYRFNFSIPWGPKNSPIFDITLNMHKKAFQSVIIPQSRQVTLNSEKSIGLVTKKSLRKRGLVIKKSMKQLLIKLRLANWDSAHRGKTLWLKKMWFIFWRAGLVILEYLIFHVMGVIISVKESSTFVSWLWLCFLFLIPQSYSPNRCPCVA